MSVFSSISSAFSSITSAVSTSTSIKVYIVIAVLVAGLAGSAWMYVHSLQSTITAQAGTIGAQVKTITKQESDIQTAKSDRDEAINQRDQAQKRTSQLNTENQLNEKALEAARISAQALSADLADAQRGDICAKHPVPDRVKRLQQQAIREFNAEYGDSAGDQTGKAAAGGNVPAS